MIIILIITLSLVFLQFDGLEEQIGMIGLRHVDIGLTLLRNFAS